MSSKYIMGLVAKGTTNVGGDDTVLQIWGLYHLAGNTVSAFVNAADCGDYTVAADGSISILMNILPAVNLANLIAANGSYGEMDCATSVVSGGVTNFITIPIVVGNGFVTQGQLLRPATQADIKSPTGDALGKKRRIYRFGALLREALLTQFGTELTPSPLGNMHYAHFSTVPDEENIIPRGQTFSGVYWSDVEDSSGYDGQVCWQMDRPWPTTVCAISAFIETGNE